MFLFMVYDTWLDHFSAEMSGIWAVVLKENANLLYETYSYMCPDI